MFHRNSIISACLALVVLLSSTAVLAENDNPASQQPSSQESANKQSVDEIKLRIGSGDPVAGKSKAELCFGCHGEDGNSTDPQYPKLAGQYGMYIAKQVRNYQATTRTHMIMSGMAASVSDEDLADIAAYFASQPMMKGDHPPSNKIGKKLFENDDLSRMMVRCNNCHGATGKGQNPGNPVYPVIGGQHKDYLLGQLLNFRKGVRNNSPGGVMNITVHRLSDAELEALAEYVSGL
jgi:cytochrome c553